jgi:hypothetical protein
MVVKLYEFFTSALDECNRFTPELTRSKHPLSSLTQTADNVSAPAGYRIPFVHIAASRLGNCAGLCPVHRLESFDNVFVIIPSKYNWDTLTNLQQND